MLEKVKKENGQTVLKLTKFERIWICSECKREFKIAPPQCPCGAVDKVFIEKDLPVKESKRREYLVNSNIIFESNQILANQIISLPINEDITKSLLARKLISEIKEEEEKKIPAVAEVK